MSGNQASDQSGKQHRKRNGYAVGKMSEYDRETVRLFVTIYFKSIYLDYNNTIWCTMSSWTIDLDIFLKTCHMPFILDIHTICVLMFILWCYVLLGSSQLLYML